MGEFRRNKMEDVKSVSKKELIYELMPRVMADISPVAKSQTNSFQNYKFRGVDQFVNALHPALVKHQVFMAPECVSETHDLREKKDGKMEKHVSVQMKYHFYAVDGSSVVVGPIPSEGIDSSDKATNKALSAALKYALIQTFAIPTEDMAESDSEHHPISKSIPKQQASSSAVRNKSGLEVSENVFPNKHPMSETSDPDTYVVPFGKKYKGMRLKDVPIEDARKYRDYLLKESKGELSEQAEEFIYMVDLLDTSSSSPYFENYKGHENDIPR